MSQLKRKFIANDAVNGSKIRLDSEEFLRSRNAADDGDVNLFKLNANDEMELGGNLDLSTYAIKNASELALIDTASEFSVKLQPGELTGDLTFVLPISTGTDGQLLSTDGAGQLSWKTVTVDFSPYLKKDGSVAMTGDLEMGSVTPASFAEQYNVASGPIAAEATWNVTGLPITETTTQVRVVNFLDTIVYATISVSYTLEDGYTFGTWQILEPGYVLTVPVETSGTIAFDVTTPVGATTQVYMAMTGVFTAPVVNPNAIHYVANGVDAYDAVNKGQLDSAITNLSIGSYLKKDGTVAMTGALVPDTNLGRSLGNYDAAFLTAYTKSVTYTLGTGLLSSKGFTSIETIPSIISDLYGSNLSDTNPTTTASWNDQYIISGYDGLNASKVFIGTRDRAVDLNSGLIHLRTGGVSGTGIRANILLDAAAVDVSSSNIINVLDPVNDQDAATKIYVDNAIDAIDLGVFLRADGTVVATGALDMGEFKITNMGAPTDDTDAATKGYVDGLVGGLAPVDDLTIKVNASNKLEALKPQMLAYEVTATDILNQYFELPVQAYGDEVIMIADGGSVLIKGSGKDYSTSHPDDVTRISFETEYAALVEAGDIIVCFYNYLNAPII